MIINLPNFNPNLFEFNNFVIRYYSLAYIFGILFTNFFLGKANKTYHLMTKKAFESWLGYMVISIILGGRLGYVIFYNPKFFLGNPLEIFALWHGGMSFHGGFIGAVFGIWLFAKRHHVRFLQLADVIAVSAPFGLCLGRIANFINLELYGRVTHGNFGVIFPNVDNLPRHPSQLYEASLEGFILFSVLLYCFYRTSFFKKPGAISGVFLIGYSISRVIAEFFREPDMQIGLFFNFITMGQILSIPLLVTGIFLIFKTLFFHKIKHRH
jgi:phosphatidylglycerol:prolipoprotein diacylglycerol transferase